MKNPIKKIVSLAMLPVLTIPFFAGCKGDDDKNKTVLKIGVYNGGLGYAWAEDLEKKFEEAYADVSFEEGKKGVNLKINPQKELFDSETVQATIMQNQDAEDVYYTFYRAGGIFSRKGLASNITDIVTEKCYKDDGSLAEYNAETGTYVGATKSLADKLSTEYQKAFYFDAQEVDYDGDGAPNIKEGYYSLPYQDDLSGFIYDYDLFKEKGWLDYDGVDGLPDTIEDFFDLMDRIVSAGMIPYTFAATQTFYYTSAFRDAFMTQYEGYDNASLAYTYDGTYTFPADTFDADTVEEENMTVNSDGTQTVTITPQNAWMLAYQPSKTAYIEFMRDLVDPKYFDPDASSTTLDFTGAQQQFILSKLGKQGQKRIAMIYEGEWWENEARANFNYTGGYGSRDFRFFPMPYISGQKDENARSLGTYYAGCSLFVNEKSTKKDLVRLWLQFSHSESALETQTIMTGVTRAYDFDLDDSQLAKMTPFGRNTYQIKKGLYKNKGESGNLNVEVATEFSWADGHLFYSSCPMGGLGARNAGALGSTATTQNFGEIDYADSFIIKVFFEEAGKFAGEKKLSAAEYIDGMYDYYTKENWTNAYNSWLNLQQ